MGGLVGFCGWLTDFGQTDFGQFFDRFWPIVVVVVVLCFVLLLFQIAKKLIQKHFHPKTLSSKISSNFIHDIFVQKWVHPMTLSSRNGFVLKP